MDDPTAPSPALPSPQADDRWWAPAPDPELPPVGARRAYTEVLSVYLAFFAVGIIAAGLLLGGRSKDLPMNGSWGIYLTNAVGQIAEIGLAVAVVLLLAARRGVTPAALGLLVPRQTDGRFALARTIRMAAWAFFAIIVGDIINFALRTGTLPTGKTSAPQLIFGVVDALQAGVIEELVVLAFVVVSLRQAGRPWWEVATVALVLRGAYHIYYGPGVVGILVWAALYLWIYLRFRQVVVLMVCHALWDAVAFLSQATVAVVVIGELFVAGLWITSVIMWLVERNNRPATGVSRGGVGGPVVANPYRPPDPYLQPAASWTPAGSPGPASVPSAGGAGTVPPPRSDQPVPPVLGPPPGWHPDPAGHNRWRWWDGCRWTEHVSEPI